MSWYFFKVWTLTGLLMILAIQGAHATDKEISLLKEKAFEILNYEPLPPMELLRKAFEQAVQEGERPSWEWSLDAFGKHFQFDLESNDRLIARLPKAQREKIAAKYKLYRGKIEGMRDSWIRLTQIGDQWSGMIWDGEEVYIIDRMNVMSPALRTTPLEGQFEHGIYRLSDTKHLGQTACGVESSGTQDKPLVNLQALSQELEQSVSASAVGASLNIDLAIVTDPQFAEIQQNSFGTATDAAVLARVNVVDGIYSEQVGVQINLVEILELSNNGPLTSTSSATLLDQFGEFTNSSQFNHPGVAHLFTGRNMDGGTVGRAYLGTICNARYGVGINEIRQGGTAGSILFAHELAHNFNAPHDNQVGSPCSSTPGNFIMNPTIFSENDEFSQCSLEQMQPKIASASCITEIGSAGADVSLNLPAPLDAPIGIPFNYEIEAQNTGTITANNVNVEVRGSSGLAILEAMVGGNPCSLSGGTLANCFIGDIPKGQNRIMTLSLQGDNSGLATVDAEITADNDQNNLNDAVQGNINLTNTEPTVSITDPLDGAFLSAENNISFTGEASDIEEGNLSDQIVWTSDLDGQIGIGANISTTLSIGTHRITASVNDNGGGQASAAITITVEDGLNDSILFEFNFDNGADGFSYLDDAFRNTNEPSFADGTYEPDQGFSGGGLRVLLGGINNADITDMSGGWSRSFDLATSGEVTLSFRYKLTQASNYENDELSQALLEMDGTLFGTDNNEYLAQRVGDGNGGSPQTTDWVPVVFNLGTLEAGPHVVTIGAFNNKKTYNDETTEVLFDDVVVRQAASDTPPPPPDDPPDDPLINATFDGGPEEFTYGDDPFRNTNQPTYASGSYVPDQGFSGGGLRVLLGGINGSDILNMSGGWGRSFTLEEPRDLTLTFRYNLTQASDFEADEYSEALLEVNGQLLGTGPNQSLARITGNGNGGSDESTGWVLFTENLGTVPAGTHTITIGGFNNKKTYSNEVTEVLIDDVTLE